MVIRRVLIVTNFALIRPMILILILFYDFIHFRLILEMSNAISINLLPDADLKMAVSSCLSIGHVGIFSSPPSVEVAEVPTHYRLDTV